MKKFAVGVSRWSNFSATDHDTFLLTKAKSNRDTKRTPYSAHQSNKLCKNKSGHAGSHRAQLFGVTLGRLRRQKLAEKLIFYEGQKKWSQMCNRKFFHTDSYVGK
jgi:hypothetical protein